MSHMVERASPSALSERSRLLSSASEKDGCSGEHKICTAIFSVDERAAAVAVAVKAVLVNSESRGSPA